MAAAWDAVISNVVAVVIGRCHSSVKSDKQADEQAGQKIQKPDCDSVRIESIAGHRQLVIFCGGV
jgi:hypothetical protein